MSLFESLGFTINREKSQLVPTHQICFLGFQMDSENMKPFLSEDKMEQIIQMCLCPNTLYPSGIHYPGSAPCTTLVSKPPTNEDSVTQMVVFMVTLDPSSIEELMWWSTQLHLWNGRDVYPKVLDMTTNTDASLTGWRAVCTGGYGIQGRVGFTSTSLMEQVCGLWQWCLQRDITLSTEYIPTRSEQLCSRQGVSPG